MDIQPFCNSQIVFLGRSELNARLLCLGVQNVVLLMNKTGVERWHFSSIIDDMRRKYQLTWIDHCPANPTQYDIIEGLRLIGDKNVDVFVAVGGGSVIDLAKALNAFYDVKKNLSYQPMDVAECIKSKSYKGKAFYADIVAVPTTAGTGAEITHWGTVWNMDEGNKYSIDTPELKPKLALLCPELTMTLPRRFVLTTGLDTLAHAMEAFWSKHTTVLVKDIAAKAIDTVANNLGPALEQPDDYILRERLCRASVLSALAFSQTRTTACHSMSYPLTIMFGVEHGFAAALTLAEVYELNRPATAEIETLDKIFLPFGGFRNWIDSVCDGIVKLRLSGFGIGKADIDSIVHKAFTAGRMDNNPVDLNEEDVRALLLRIL